MMAETEGRETECWTVREARDMARAGLVVSLAGYALGVPQQELRKPTRGAASAAFARQVAMYVTHVAFEMSLSRVAAAFRRDRSTVSHACHLVEDRRDDPGFDAWMDALEQAARSAPPPRVELQQGRQVAPERAVRV